MNWIALGLLLAFCFFAMFSSTENFRSVADPRNYGSAAICVNDKKCDVESRRKCAVNYGGYEITPLRPSGFDVKPLHDPWNDPDYLGDAGWCQNPHNPTPDVKWVDPPVLDYRIKNPAYCYNSYA